jgi:hypothetical protein
MARENYANFGEQQKAPVKLSYSPPHGMKRKGETRQASLYSNFKLDDKD